MVSVHLRPTVRSFGMRLLLVVGVCVAVSTLSPSVQAALEVRIVYNNGINTRTDTGYTAYSGPVNLTSLTSGLFTGSVTASSDNFSLDIQSETITATTAGSQIYVSFREIVTGAFPQQSSISHTLNLSAGSTLGGASAGVAIGALYFNNSGTALPSFPLAASPSISAVPLGLPYGIENLYRVSSIDSGDSFGPSLITLSSTLYEMHSDFILGFGQTTDRFSFASTTRALIVPEPSTMAIALTAIPIFVGATWYRRRRLAKA